MHSARLSRYRLCLNAVELCSSLARLPRPIARPERANAGRRELADRGGSIPFHRGSRAPATLANDLFPPSVSQPAQSRLYESQDPARGVLSRRLFAFWDSWTIGVYVSSCRIRSLRAISH